MAYWYLSKIRATIPALIILTAAGCATAPPDFRTVEIPVTRIAAPPPELLAPVELPTATLFVAPTDPRAVSALTPDGEQALRGLIGRLMDRLDAWKAWSNGNQ